MTNIWYLYNYNLWGMQFLFIKLSKDKVTMLFILYIGMQFNNEYI